MKGSEILAIIFLGSSLSSSLKNKPESVLIVFSFYLRIWQLRKLIKQIKESNLISMVLLIITICLKLFPSYNSFWHSDQQC